MEVKKMDEAVCVVSRMLSLLSQYPSCRSVPSAVLEELQTRCNSLLSCLSILRGIEQDHHKKIEIDFVNGDSSEESLLLSEKIASVYNLVSIVLSQVAHYNHDAESFAISEGREEEREEGKGKEEEDGDGDDTGEETDASLPPNRLHQTSREITLQKVYGCEEAKKALLHTLYLPIRFPFLFTAPRKPLQKLLLYGPPGTGKTLLAHAAANTLSSSLGALAVPVFTVTASQLLDKYVGESEKQIQRIFNDAKQYVGKNANSKCVLFFDEIDALCGARGSEKESELSRRVKTELLLALQSVEQKGNASIIIIAATNLPWEIDTAIRRRFDRFVYVGLPDPTARFRMLYDTLSGTDHRIREEEVREFIELDAVQLCSPSDLTSILQHTLMKPYETFFSHGILDNDGLSHRLPLREAEEADWIEYEAEQELPSLHSTYSSESSSPSSGAESVSYRIPHQSYHRDRYRKWYVFCSPADARCVGDRSVIRQSLHASHQRDLLEEETLYILEDQILLPPILYSHMLDALNHFIPTITKEDIERYENWSRL